MSADQWTPGERLAALLAQEINDVPAEELIRAAMDDVLRQWSAKIRDVGLAKGWSVWAAAFMDPDTPFSDTGKPSTETIVAKLRRMDRVENLRRDATALLRLRSRHASRAIFCDGIAYAADQLANWADEAEQEKDTGAGRQPFADESTPVSGPLIVDRFDVAMEPAPEEEPIFTIGALAVDGRPVALRFDPETRHRVAGWLGAYDARHPSETTSAAAHATDAEGPRQ